MKKILLLTAALLVIGSVSARAADEVVNPELLENYKKHCASCHGPDGKGKTKMGRKAKVKDYTDAKFIATIKDAEALKKVKEGLRDDKGKFTMKPYEKKLKDDEIKALIAYMKAFAKPAK